MNIRMNSVKNIVFMLIAWVCLTTLPAGACTSAVVSGKATPDGRPLLWKHRDTDFLRNHVAYVQGEKYAFVAVVNSDDFHHRREAWIGMNEAGFALMNTQSYNLETVKEGEERGAANGRIIYRALEFCATVDDFRHFLDTLAKPSLIEANLGVIDAKGGAAMFEVDYDSYVMFDANNPADAPHGYIVRTNFSVSGTGPGAGQVRYLEAERRFKQAADDGNLTPHFILHDVSRSFRNCKLGIDLRDAAFNPPHTSGWFVDQDFIPRRSTSCSVVVQGVKPGEAAELTTMWTLLGYPPTGVTLPVWLKKTGGGELPPLLAREGAAGTTSQLCQWSQALADSVFSYHAGMGTERYLHWEKLYNASGTGYMQQLEATEEEVFRLTAPLLERWRQAGGISAEEMRALHRRLQACLHHRYETLLNESSNTL